MMASTSLFFLSSQFFGGSSFSCVSYSACSPLNASINGTNDLKAAQKLPSQRSLLPLRTTNAGLFPRPLQSLWIPKGLSPRQSFKVPQSSELNMQKTPRLSNPKNFLRSRLFLSLSFSRQSCITLRP
ncbi:hypothetical protein FPOAC2_06752 [Fusarium poae]